MSELAQGRYFGHVESRTECAQAVLSEVHHHCASCPPKHAHERAYFSTLLSGSYFEEIDGQRFEYRPFETGFHPAQMPHHDGIGTRGARFLCIEITSQTLADLSIDLGSKPLLLADELAVTMARAWRRVATKTFSSLCLESVLWELAGTISRFSSVLDRRAPPWLLCAVDLIRCEYGQPLTVLDIARRIDIHPVHLSREFRRRFGQTVGEYANRVRAHAACSQLFDDDKTLARVAMDCGFFDHSHFCRVFKDLLGCSPTAFRRTNNSARFVGTKRQRRILREVRSSAASQAHDIPYTARSSRRHRDRNTTR